MKQIALIIVLIFLAFNSICQTLDRMVIGSLGGVTDSNGGPRFYYNLGETFVDTKVGVGYTLTEGFEQPSVDSITPILGETLVCIGSLDTLTNSFADGIWYSNDTNIATVDSNNGVVTAINTGIDTISYSVSGNSVFIIITVNPLPDAGIIVGASFVCLSDVTTLIDTVAGGIWSSSSTGVVINSGGVVTGIESGNVVVSYSITNTCGTTYTANTITVLPLPGIDNISGSNSLCIGAVISLNDTISGGIWNSTNDTIATIDSSGIVTGVSSGVTTISYTTSNNCGSNYVTMSVLVNQPPSLISGNNVICSGMPDSLSDSVFGGTWYSSATTIASITDAGIITGIATGTANISYIISGCVPAVYPITINICRIGGNEFETVATEMNAYSINPNPGNGNIIMSQRIVADETVTAKVVNTLGQTVYSKTINFSGGTSQLNISDNESGIYVLVLLDNNGKSYTFNLVIEK